MSRTHRTDAARRIAARTRRAIEREERRADQFGTGRYFV